MIYEQPILRGWVTLLESLPLHKGEGNSAGERSSGGEGAEGRDEG